MRAFPSVVFGEPALAIFSVAAIGFTGNFNRLQNISVKHGLPTLIGIENRGQDIGIKRRWPAIGSTEPATLDQPSYAPKSGATEGTILRPEPKGSGRRMVEAAGVEPASLLNQPAATTCLARRIFSAMRWRPGASRTA